VVDFALVNEIMKSVVPFDFLATKLIATILVYFEWISINENFKAIKGKSLGEAFKEMIDKLKGIGGDIKELKK
jgi:hypothetical protein